MNRTYLIPLAAGLLCLGAAPSSARITRSGLPPERNASIFYDRGEGFLEADIALRSLNLTGKQRNKIHKVVDKYARRIEDARRDRNLAPSKREDRIWKARRDMRKDVMKELTREQRERVESIARRQDRSDRRDSGPSWRW